MAEEERSFEEAGYLEFYQSFNYLGCCEPITAAKAAARGGMTSCLQIAEEKKSLKLKKAFLRGVKRAYKESG
jgi:hypothetical protein